MGLANVTIDHNNLLHNLEVAKKRAGDSKILAVVKANAYGHGMIEVAHTIEEEGVAYFGVFYHDEAIHLREAGIKSPILVFAPQMPNEISLYSEYNLDLTISSTEQLQLLLQECHTRKMRCNVHIKLETGMNRLGFQFEEFKELAPQILKSEYLNVVGIYSHLSSSDEEDACYTEKQIKRFQQIKDFVSKNYSNKIIYHLANSAGTKNYPSALFDMVRVGVMLYGSTSVGGQVDSELKEVMSQKTRVISVKKIGPNEPVSYSRRFHTMGETTIATIAAGYAEGFNRKFTNNGTVLIGGKKYPIVGAVCMDQTLVNIGNDTHIKVGDEVTLFGNQGNESISISEVAQRLETIPYEVMCWPSQRVKRIHINRNGK